MQEVTNPQKPEKPETTKSYPVQAWLWSLFFSQSSDNIDCKAKRTMLLDRTGLIWDRGGRRLFWDSSAQLLPRQWSKEETDEVAEQIHRTPLEDKNINSQAR